MLKNIILGSLSFGQALTGYELKKVIEDGIGVFYKASYGSLYPTLKRLETEHCITMAEDTTTERRKKYYSITAAGKTEFQSWLLTPIDISDSSSTSLAKIYFFDQLPEAARKRQIAEYEYNNIRYLRKLMDLRSHFSSHKNMEDHYYKLSTLYYGIAITQETIRWCRHISDRKLLDGLVEDKLIEVSLIEESLLKDGVVNKEGNDGL